MSWSARRLRGLSAFQPVSYMKCGKTFVRLRECLRSTYSLRVFSDRNT
jgi:hypothetical protein